jgi:hypothetical protein
VNEGDDHGPRPDTGAQVVNGDREGRARTDAQRPRARRGMIAKDFAFRGILAANELSEFRDHGPAAALPG